MTLRGLPPSDIGEPEYKNMLVAGKRAQFYAKVSLMFSVHYFQLVCCSTRSTGPTLSLVLFSSFGRLLASRALQTTFSNVFVQSSCKAFRIIFCAAQQKRLRWSWASRCPPWLVHLTPRSPHLSMSNCGLSALLQGMCVTFCSRRLLYHYCPC